MPLLKKIVQNNHREVIVKWTGSGTDVLSLPSLVSSGQTVVGTPAVNIISVSCSISNNSPCIISRAGEETLHVHGGYEFQTDGLITAVLSENNSSDITVDLQQTGTLILRVRKAGGYSEIQ